MPTSLSKSPEEQGSIPIPLGMDGYAESLNASIAKDVQDAEAIIHGRIDIDPG